MKIAVGSDHGGIHLKNHIREYLTAKGIEVLDCGTYTEESTEHNNANVLCMGERVIGVGLAEMITDTWLQGEFAGGRHERRVDKIAALEAMR